MLWWLIGFLIAISAAALDDPPQLECLNDGMRMHFIPHRSQPFSGHIYVKGFFFSRNCHLDYTHHSLTEPFFFHVPYRSECQVHRERTTQPSPGQTYSIVLVVQHHPLFVTENDKAYSLSCFYSDQRNRLEQQVEINDISTSQIQDEPLNPDCSYEVLAGGIQGQVVKFANIGDILVHKWTCDTEEQGILVHSCFVRDGVGNEFSILDDRGCITDGSLLQQPLTYSDGLNQCYTPISAFKFADQMVVYFSCQITLCKKADNGCEGITPPVCRFRPLPNEGGSSPQVITRRPDSDDRSTTRGAFGNVTTAPGSTTTFRPITIRTSTPAGDDYDEQPILFPHRSGFPSSRHARGKRHVNASDLITVDVMADGMIVFTKDESPALTAALATEPRLVSSAVGWLLAFLMLLAASVISLAVQRRFYRHRIEQIRRHFSATPFELGFVSQSALSSAKSTPQSRRHATVSPYAGDPFGR